MTFRFRRSVQVIPGVKINLGKRGVSLSTGQRGSNLTLGRRGLHQNFGLPGTGLSYRTRIDKSAAIAERQPSGTNEPETYQFMARLKDDGSVVLTKDSSDVPLPEARQREFRKQFQQELQEWLVREVERFNATVEGIKSIHLETPSADVQSTPSIGSFDMPMPVMPSEPAIGFADQIMFRASRIRADHQVLMADYRAAIADWEQAKLAHAHESERLKELSERCSLGDLQAMEEIFATAISAIAWPLSTEVEFDLGDDAGNLEMDVLVSPLDDMPERVAVAASRGLRVTFKQLRAKERCRDHLLLVSATIFRLAGEAFAVLPTVHRIELATWCIAIDRATGREKQSCLAAIRVEREQWTSLDLSHPGIIDPILALEQFELQRDIDRNGALREISQRVE